MNTRFWGHVTAHHAWEEKWRTQVNTVTQHRQGSQLPATPTGVMAHLQMLHLTNNNNQQQQQHMDSNLQQPMDSRDILDMIKVLTHRRHNQQLQHKLLHIQHQKVMVKVQQDKHRLMVHMDNRAIPSLLAQTTVSHKRHHLTHQVTNSHNNRLQVLLHLMASRDTVAAASSSPGVITRAAVVGVGAPAAMEVDQEDTVVASSPVMEVVAAGVVPTVAMEEVVVAAAAVTHTDLAGVAAVHMMTDAITEVAAAGQAMGRDDESGGGGGERPEMEQMMDTIFVSGLADGSDEDALVNHFGSIGVIKTDRRTGKPKVWIYKDKISGRPKGEATITYDDAESAKAAINWFNEKDFLGNVIKVEIAERKINPMGMRGRGRGGFRGDRGGGDRGGGRGGFGGGRGGGGGGGSERSGDWMCEEDGCSNKNFAWRNSCNLCNSPRPDGVGDDDGGFRGRGRGGFDRGGRGGFDRGRGGPRGGGRGGFGGDRGGRGGFGDRGGRGGFGDRGRGGPRGGRGFGDRGGRGGFGGDRGKDRMDRGDRRPKPY
ncbi:heterogeneous nuclear ribonucleoproteins A1 homolog isoform X3 [Argopecten irradians]|uniref:heterogeneous nuclear ribonucleoproteins A1 homolog isoform X3 n=1 Tax=Argopecten irradians TaxID=31199 RepID=UPI003710F659